MKSLARPLAFALLMLLAIAPPALSQSHVLGRPKVYDSPEYGRRYTPAELKGYSKDIPWLVVADRVGALAYQRPNEGGASVPLTFLDDFYVVDADGDWLKLVKCTSDGLKIVSIKREIGWVRRENVLEWTSGLRSPYTNVQQKAFLHNHLDFLGEAIDSFSETVEAYADPNGRSTLRRLDNNDFYFILKKENGYYLLCRDEQVSIFDLKSKIAGWVHQNQCADWNTRIALEPNFSQAAFDERKANPNFRVRAYGDFQAAAEHAQTGQAPPMAIWENDPVLLPPAQRAGNRYLGQVMRFPLYTSGEVDQKLEIFSSSVIADIVVGQQQPASGNSSSTVNVFFVAEGTAAMSSAKLAIEQAIQKMSNGLGANRPLRVGALVYRHPADQFTVEGDKMIEVQPLSSDLAQTLAFVRATKFKRWKNATSFACPLYALKMAAQKAGFREGETNLVFLVGNSPDYRADEGQREQYLSHASAVNEQALAWELLRANAQVYIAQTKAGAGAELIGQLQRLGGRTPLVRGVCSPEKFSPSQLAELLFAKTQAALSPDKEEGEGSFEETSSPSCGFFAPNVLARNNSRPSAPKRYSVLSKAYFPRKVAGAKHPMFSCVAFMSESDVSDYRKILGRLVGNPPPTMDGKRSSLIEFHLALLKQFTGKDFSEGAGREAFDQMTRQQVLEHITGVAGAGLDFEVPINVKMSCILDVNCMTDAQVLALFERMAQVLSYMETALRNRGYASEILSFKSVTPDGLGGLYYWMPIESIF